MFGMAYIMSTYSVCKVNIACFYVICKFSLKKLPVETEANSRRSGRHKRSTWWIMDYVQFIVHNRRSKPCRGMTDKTKECSCDRGNTQRVQNFSLIIRENYALRKPKECSSGKPANAFSRLKIVPHRLLHLFYLTIGGGGAKFKMYHKILLIWSNKTKGEIQWH